MTKEGVEVFVFMSETILLLQPIAVMIEKPEGVEDLWITVQYDVFNSIRLRNKPFYVLGDFNCNMLVDNKMKQIINNVKLTQLINKPRRTTPHSATLLDIIVTNRPDLAPQ